ncbi:TonB-dependent receptor [Longibacter salinarum]|uniref:TonB-dependent receptor n=1 Tax=Longibacter salinarum TaxID=1850348 RepID=A0A2A8D1R9_9BACT|nr:TonB-dependent receptor [Longibacter salinarum]PEN14830.1 TonB-dependent receptor [Longibacter salinarum]
MRGSRKTGYAPLVAIFVAVVLAVSSLLSPQALAQRGPEPVVLRGFVRDADTGRPLSGANVVLLDSTKIVKAVASSSDGFYQIYGPAPAEYTLRVSFVGYETDRRPVTLEPGMQTVEINLAARNEALDGVTVEARRKVETAQAGLKEILPADLQTIPMPGPGSDLAGYLRSLPSVATLGDRGGRLYVRGGTPSQNLILVDGIPIYKPFHIIGFYSAFPSELVASADFYAGGFGAEYRNTLSSVLDVNLRPGNLKSFEGGVSGSPFAASARAEGPIVNGSSSFLVHARQSVIEPVGPTLLGEDTPYRFYDVTARLFTQSENSQCSVTGIRTYDRGAINPARDARFKWANTSAGVRCLTFGSRSPQIVDVSFGTARFTNEISNTEGSDRSATTWVLRTDLKMEQEFGWGTTSGGFSVDVNRFKYGFQEPFVGVDADDEFLLKLGGFVGAGIDIGDAVTVSPSIGTELPVGWSNLTIEPRLRASWQPGNSDRMKLSVAGGLYRQLSDAVVDERDAGSSFLAWVADPQSRPPQAIHAMAGWSQQLTDALRVNIEGYYKTMQDLPVAKWTPQPIFNTSLAPADAEAYGGSVVVEYKQGWLDLSANYGLSKVVYSAATDDLGAWTGGTVETYTPPHDQRHRVGLRAAADVLGGTASLRWQFSTGRPFTQSYGSDAFLEILGIRDLPEETFGRPRLLYSETYGGRLPSYHRLDASFERPFQIRPGMELTLEAGAINAYDRNNVFYFDLFLEERVDQLPVVPYLGLEISFQ